MSKTLLVLVGVAILSTACAIYEYNNANRLEGLVLSGASSSWSQVGDAYNKIVGSNSLGRCSVSHLKENGEQSTISVRLIDGDEWTCKVDSFVGAVALVTPDVVAYYGYNDSITESANVFCASPPYETFVVGAIRRNGYVIIREAYNRTGIEGSVRGVYPTGVSIIPSIDGTSFIIQSVGENLRYERAIHLAVYSIVTGKCTNEVDGNRLSRGKRYLYYARGFYAIAGVPLYIVEWYSYGKGPSGGPGFAITIVDDHFNVIKEIEWLDDYKDIVTAALRPTSTGPDVISRNESSAIVILKDDLESLYSTWPRRSVRCIGGEASFFVYSMKRLEQIKYSVMKDASGGWLIEPVYTEPIVLDER